MTASQIKEIVQNHLISGEIEDAFTSLLTVLNQPSYSNVHEQVMALKVQWETTKQEQIKGVISRADYELSFNRIIAGIQSVLNQLDQPAMPQAAPGGNRSSFLLVGALLLVVVAAGGYYWFQTKTPVTVPAPTPQTALKTDQPAGDVNAGQVKSETSVSTAKKPVNNQPVTNAAPSTVQTKPSVSPSQPAKTVQESTPPPVLIEVKMILTDPDVNIKIDGSAPAYVGTETGRVRTIRIAKGVHKFEVTEDGFQCKKEISISEPAQKIYPTCK